jgi:hypothetical protein
MRDERFKVCSVMDDALDMSAPEMVKYFESRDFSMLRFHPGAKPMVFHVREVPHGLWESFVAAGANERERYKLAFRAGITKVENLIQGDGVAVPSWEPTQRLPNQPDVVILSEDEANKLFSPSEREEIGSVIYRHSFLPRRIKCSYQLPHSCLEPLGTRTFRPVDASPSTAEVQSNAKQLATSTQSQDVTASA